jgi:hypothetical protein
VRAFPWWEPRSLVLVEGALVLVDGRLPIGRETRVEPPIRLVEAQGGSIDARSAHGKTTFRFTLPRVMTQAQGASSGATQPSMESRSAPAKEVQEGGWMVGV